MTPRGIRNFNPGNLRLGQPWLGLVKNPEEKQFCTFESAAFGIRALCRLLMTYHRPVEQKGYGLNTVRDIIDRYAPDIENDTSAYVYHVAERLDVGINQTIDLTDPAVMHELISAIILHENGINPYTTEIRDGMLMAGMRLE